MKSSEFLTSVLTAICFTKCSLYWHNTLFYIQYFVSIFIIFWCFLVWKLLTGNLHFLFGQSVFIWTIWSQRRRWNCEKIIPRTMHVERRRIWSEKFSLSCSSGQQKLLWLKCVAFVYVMINDSIKVQAAAQIACDEDLSKCHSTD